MTVYYEKDVNKLTAGKDTYQMKKCLLADHMTRFLAGVHQNYICCLIPEGPGLPLIEKEVRLVQESHDIYLFVLVTETYSSSVNILH